VGCDITLTLARDTCLAAPLCPPLTQVAIKVIDKSALQPKQLQKLYREVRILKKLDHPHIIKLYEVLESDDQLFLVLEYVSGGELYDFLIAQGKMKERDARTRFLQIMSALLYCHSRRIIHRDLKAENLLLDKDLNLKVAGAWTGPSHTPRARRGHPGLMPGPAATCHGPRRV